MCEREAEKLQATWPQGGKMLGTSIWRCSLEQRQAVSRGLVCSWDLHGCACEQARPQVRQMFEVEQEERAERWVSERRTGSRQCHGIQTPLITRTPCPLVFTLLALISKALTYVTLTTYFYVPQLCIARTFLEQLRGATRESYLSEL